jgi:hypothetical protein
MMKDVDMEFQLMLASYFMRICRSKIEEVFGPADTFTVRPVTSGEVDPREGDPCGSTNQ